MSVPRTARRPRGFTLVELLVVIGIIALLISILLPSLNRARAAAAGVVCQSNLRQAGIGLLIYAQANDGALPPADTPQFDGSGTVTGGWHPFWYDHVAAAVGVKAGTADTNHDPKAYADAFVCPSAPRDGGFIHYAVHPRLMPPQVPWVPPAMFPPRVTLGGRLFMAPYKLVQVPESTRTLVAADASQFVGNGDPGLADLEGNAFYALSALNSFSIYWNQFQTGYGNLQIDGVDVHADSPVRLKMGTVGNEDSARWYEADVRFRHDDDEDANVLFLDGHVGSLRLSKRGDVWNDGRPDGGQLTQKHVMLVAEEEI